MKTKFDLTNKKELLSVIADYVGPGLIISPIDPIVSVGKYIFEKLFSKDTIKAQQEAAESLIKKGKENGVDEMEITVDNTRGFKLNVPMDDVKIDTVVGADEKMVIKVKYK